MTDDTGAATQPGPPSLVCPKDGGTEISTRWHPDVWSCTYAERSRLGDDVGEHLHRTCDSCHYDWISPTLDAEPQVTY